MDNDIIINALRKGLETLEEVVNTDLLISGTTIREEAVTAIILMGEAIEAIEEHYEESE